MPANWQAQCRRRGLPAVLQRGDEVVAGLEADRVEAGDQRRNAPVPLRVGQAHVAVDNSERVRDRGRRWRESLGRDRACRKNAEGGNFRHDKRSKADDKAVNRNLSSNVARSSRGILIGRSKGTHTAVMEFLAASFVLLRGRARRQRAQFVNQEKTMTSISKLALIATFAAAGIASPAFAQSDTNSHSHRIPAHLSGRLFDMAPQDVSARDLTSLGHRRRQRRL